MWTTGKVTSLLMVFLEKKQLLPVRQDSSNTYEIYIFFKKKEYAESHASAGGVWKSIFFFVLSVESDNITNIVIFS